MRFDRLNGNHADGTQSNNLPKQMFTGPIKKWLSVNLD